MKACKSKYQCLIAWLALDGLHTCYLIWNEPWLIDSSLCATAVAAGKQLTIHRPWSLFEVRRAHFFNGFHCTSHPCPNLLSEQRSEGSAMGGVLSLWWGGANSIAGLGEVVAFLRGKEVLGGMRTLLLSPTSATTNSETLLVSISIKWESQVCLCFLTYLEPWSPWESLEARTLLPRNMSMYIYTPRPTGKPWIRWSFQAIPALVLLKVLMLLWTMWKGKVHYLNSGD